MVSRNIYLQLVFRIVLIVLTVVVTTYLFFKGNYVGCAIGILILIGQTSALINYVNQTNRKIAYFFDAIKNEDFTLRFPEKLSVKSLEELNHSLNMLNSMIQDIHLKKTGARAVLSRNSAASGYWDFYHQSQGSYSFCQSHRSGFVQLQALEPRKATQSSGYGTIPTLSKSGPI